MEYRRLGRSDLAVPVVTLGTWAIGGFMWAGTDEEEAIRAIQTSIDLGVTSIDTAPVYGLGLSERIIGKAIAGRRDRVQILTKFGLSWGDPAGRKCFATRDVDGKTIEIFEDARRQTVIKECEDSLKRLGTDYIDLYQQHWPDPQTPLDETMEAVEKLLKDGKIRAVGVSNFSVDQMTAASNCLESSEIAANQMPYSMLKRDIEKEVLPYCILNNVGLLAYSPLERGLLSGRIPTERAFPDSDHRAGLPLFSTENRRRVNRFLHGIRGITDVYAATPAQVVINWTIQQPGITAALVGARTTQQAEENARAADLRLTEVTLRDIDSKLAQLRLAQ